MLLKRGDNRNVNLVNLSVVASLQFYSFLILEFPSFTVLICLPSNSPIPLVQHAR